jgi:hypothetical protein
MSYSFITDSPGMGNEPASLFTSKVCGSTHFGEFAAAKPTKLVDPAIPIKYFQ